MGIKCPDCGENLSLKTLLIFTTGDCWDCLKRYVVDLMTGMTTFLSHIDEDGKRIEKEE